MLRWWSLAFLPQVFGPTGALSSFLLDPSKLLLGLFFLIPLILLYLIRPKPVNVTIPSVMFILKDMGRSNMHRIFRTLLQDILFLIQFLAILLLALAFAKPFIEVDQESLVQQSILILDISASTRAFNDDIFKEIQDTAIDNLAKETIVITAHQNPVVLKQSGEQALSAGDAKNLIKGLKPTDITGDIPTALSLAEQFVGPESKVTVISDLVLSSLENPDLIAAKLKVIKSKGALIDIQTVGRDGNNIGIVDAQLNTQNATLDIKIQNFNDKLEEFGLTYNDEDLQLDKTVLAPHGQPGSFLSLSIPLGNGRSEIELTPEDDFAPDNKYYISIPEQTEVRTLMITNDDNAERSRVVPALRAAGDQFTNVNVQYGRPPKVPDLEHNIYILKDVNTQFLLPGVIKGIKEDVEAGSVLIVFAQPDLFSIDALTDADILPVVWKEANLLGGRAELLVNTSLRFMRGLSDIGQADGNQLLRVDAAENAIVYVSTPTNDGKEPVIAARRIGKGAVIYYGIKDRATFDLDPQSYAVLWGRIIDYSLVDPLVLNIPTGRVLTSSGRIKTPWGREPSPQLARTGGFYQAGPLTYAANLYGIHEVQAALETTTVRLESAINDRATIDVGEAIDPDKGTEDVKVPRDLSTLAIFLGLLIMLFELLYIKYRGDL